MCLSGIGDLMCGEISVIKVFERVGIIDYICELICVCVILVNVI